MNIFAKKYLFSSLPETESRPVAQGSFPRRKLIFQPPQLFRKEISISRMLIDISQLLHWRHRTKLSRIKYVSGHSWPYGLKFHMVNIPTERLHIIFTPPPKSPATKNDKKKQDHGRCWTFWGAQRQWRRKSLCTSVMIGCISQATGYQHPKTLAWQWKNNHLKMYLLIKKSCCFIVI